MMYHDTKISSVFIVLEGPVGSTPFPDTEETSRRHSQWEIIFCVGTLIDGSRVEVVLAKPVDKNDPKRQSKNPSLTVATTTQPFLSVS